MENRLVLNDIRNHRRIRSALPRPPLESNKSVARVFSVAWRNRASGLAEFKGVSGRNNMLQKLIGAAPVKTIQLSDTGSLSPDAQAAAHPLQRNRLFCPCSMGTLAAIAPRPHQLADCASRITLEAIGLATPLGRLLRKHDAGGERQARSCFPAFPPSTTIPPSSPRDVARQLGLRVWPTSSCPSRLCGRRGNREQFLPIASIGTSSPLSSSDEIESRRIPAVAGDSRRHARCQQCTRWLVTWIGRKASRTR